MFIFLSLLYKIYIYGILNIYFTDIYESIIMYSAKDVKEVFMRKSKNEISQSMPMLIFIILSGGLQDAYSFFCRDGVFANAQTGNVVF